MPGSLRETLAAAFKAGINAPQQMRKVDFMSSRAPVALAENALRFRSTATVQPAVRELYGKGAPLAPAFGHHPDFTHLEEGEFEKCGIVTMFMDIEGSTRLNTLFKLENIYLIKNTILRNAIDIVRAFDGHPHRLMGDAVMAFFGGKNKGKEQAVVDALNTASVLHYYMEKVVRPELEQQGLTEHPLGIRIGLDYGSDENVLWGRYGFGGMSEVTATSFFVDVVPKLQAAACRNGVMLGQSLCEFMDLPHELLETKTETAGGVTIAQPYVTPNITQADGTPMNYRQHGFAWPEYLKFAPFSSSVLDAGFATNVIRVRAEVGDEWGTSALTPLPSASAVVPKGKWIKFTCTLPFSNSRDVKVRFNVENHGRDSRDANDTKNTATAVCPAQSQVVTHWRTTAYRGLHYMFVEALGARGVFAIYVS